MADATTSYEGYMTRPVPGAEPTPPPSPPAQPKPEPPPKPERQPDPEPQPKPERQPDDPKPQPNPQRDPVPYPEADPTTRQSQPTTSRAEGPQESPPPPEPEVLSAASTTTITTRDDGGGGITTEPTQQTSPLPPPAQRTSSASLPGNITFRPGSPTAYRYPNDTSATTAPSISGSVISGPLTGVVFAFAFLGALVIGLVTGFLIAKYTRFGGGGARSRRQQRDDLTEQLRLLTDTLGQRNNNNDIHDRYFDNPPQHQFQYDRSYLDDEKLPHTSSATAGNNRAETMVPLYTHNRQSVASTVTGTAGGEGDTERLRPHSDHSRYQDWDLVGTPLMSPNPNNETHFARASAVGSTPMGLMTTTIAGVSTNKPGGGGRGSAESGSLFNPRVFHLPPTQLPPDVDINGPKGEWYHSGSNVGGGGGGNISRTSVTDLNEFERRRPQIQEEGVGGEDSLFDVGCPTNNPHVTAIME
ncbi:hypothetical protein BGZ95_005039 [Linnemannia exigua]|uniref:Uncharacterized protein n=1 Tax=Linnemannia exigua TaxID=604196 RepID=A0AAD4D2Q5_9FUNG|nr:hypothetical protein BGZ95_005039 [Linnemannia exigua]